MTSEPLAQLKQAEQLVLQDSSLYPTILPHVLALTPQPDRSLRRWIANFLNQTFASKALDAQGKEDLSILGVLEALNTLIDDGDYVLVKSCVLCSSLIYPLLFRRICKGPGESALWTELTNLKTKILTVWDRAVNEGVRIACIKFVEKVVATQTPGIKDPRLADRSDISSTIVPLNHPIIHLPALEAESQGFLDRTLSVLLERPIDPILAMAVINALGPLVKTRHTLAAKIINAFLAVDIISIPQNSSDLIKAQLQLRSVAKTIRIHLAHFLKTNAAGPLSTRIEQYLRTSQINGMLVDGEDTSRKRSATEDLSNPAKKLKSESAIVVDPAISSAFLLDHTNPLALYEAQLIPLPIVIEIILRAMAIIPPQLLDDRLNLVRTRLSELPPSPTVNDTVNGDFDDYDPEANVEFAIEPAAVVTHEEKLDDFQPMVDEEAIIHFELPAAERLPPDILKSEFQASIDRILHSVRAIDKSVSPRAGISTKSASLDSLAISEWDKEAWMTILSRLSARALQHPSSDSPPSPLPNILRERLFEYIMINFREHMDLIISWLTEEWFSETVSSSGSIIETPSYSKLSTRIFDNILPFIESKDSKIFLRFLGDLPYITPIQVNKLRTLCLDPERQKLGFTAIKYLLLLRPPAREACIDLCTDLYVNHADTKKGAADILKRWAPEKLEA